MGSDLTQYLNDARIVDANRQYWMVRSYSGMLYETFLHNKYVGVGWHDVPLELIKSASRTDLPKREELRAWLKKHYGLGKGTDTKYANQLIDFQKGMKEGDVVVIPDENSRYITLAEITSGMKLRKVNTTFEFRGKREKYPEKYRNIEILNTVLKNNIKSDLTKAFHTHEIVTNLDAYAEQIESHISPFFVIGDYGFLTIQIRQDEMINAFHFNNFLSTLTYFYHELCEELGIEQNENLYLKIQVQSKGKMALQALGFTALFALAGIFGLQDNGHVKGKYNRKTGEFEFDAGGDGFLKSLDKFLDSKEERRQKAILFNESRNALQADTLINSVEPPSSETHEERESDDSENQGDAN